MVLNVYSIFDSAAQGYMRPFYDATDALAVRNFREAVNDQASPMKKYPNDFHLVRLGMFDDQSGAFQSLTSPVRVVSASSLVEELPAAKHEHVVDADKAFTPYALRREPFEK